MQNNHNQAHCDNVAHLRGFYCDRAKEALDDRNEGNFKNAIIQLEKYISGAERIILEVGLKQRSDPQLACKYASIAFAMIKIDLKQVEDAI